MAPKEERQRLLKSDVTVQVLRGGSRRTLRGHLSRPGGRSRLHRRTKMRAHLLQAGRSLVAFLSGLLLASLYGLMGLLLQKQPLWFCAYSTVALAGLAAFGMGLSAGVRASVTVMLPSMFSARGRKFILILYVSVLVSGPLKNTLENTKRAATSLLCGAELAANQTKEMMQKAATPLFGALDEIREITSNAYAVAGRVQNFIRALTDSVRHVARTLRNVLHFLVDIGDICNDKLGAPYRKCRDLFAQARSDCTDLLGEFSFLCDIVDGFLPLCNLARAGELFCIVPSYVAAHLKQRLADPTVAAFKKMMREFDFNISASVKFHLDTNSSRSLQQVSQEIMAEISSDLRMFQKLNEPLMYASLALLGWSFLRAAMYRRRYLRDLSFDNIYINAQFKALDQQVASEGGASVLPLTRREARTYVTPLSLHLSYRERRAVLVGVASVLRHLAIGGLLVALDFLVFWILDQVRHQVKGDVVARAPAQVLVQVNGSGYASDIFRDLVASFNILQRGNITVISRKCLVEPSAPDTSTTVLLGFLLGLALVVSLTGGFVQRLRRLICASYHPEREKERIRFLRQRILNERRSLGRALRRTVVQQLAGGGAVRTLMTRIPGGGYLCRLLDRSSLTCLGCGEAVRAKDDGTIACDVPRCSGVFCRPCFHSLGNMCAVCMRPLTFQEDSELDSSDEEQPLRLPSAALNSPLVADQTSRSPLRRRRRIFTAKEPSGTGARGTAADAEVLSEGNEYFSAYPDSDLSEADVTHQDRPGPSDSDSGASFHTAPSPSTFHRQEEEEEKLTEVSVHNLDHHGNQPASPGPSRTFQPSPPGARSS